MPGDAVRFLRRRNFALRIRVDLPTVRLAAGPHRGLLEHALDRPRDLVESPETERLRGTDSGSNTVTVLWARTWALPVERRRRRRRSPQRRSAIQHDR